MAVSEDQNRLDTEQDQDRELEQYGVWVKTGPEDVDERDADDDAYALSDLGDEELDDAELEIFGREPSDDDIDSLELDELELDPMGDESDEEESSTEDLLTMEEEDLVLGLDDDIEELGAEESLDFDEPEPLSAEPITAQAGRAGPPVEESVDYPFEPELGEAGSDEASTGGGIEIEDELPGDLDDLTLDLDSLDVDSFGEPEEGSSDDITAEVEGKPTPLESDLADSVEELDFDLEEDELDLESLELDAGQEEIDASAPLASAGGVDELDLSSLPGGDDEFGALSDDEFDQDSEIDLPELEADDELSFDDLSAVEDEMTFEPQRVASAEPRDERSFSLLESIERELGSIRSELTDLRRELSHLRGDESLSAELPPSDDDEAAGGFFEDEGEDEDETIALTGAELDNIMNTAEFTEEAGRPTHIDESAIAAAGQTASVATSPVQEITLEDAPEEFGTIDLDLAGTVSADSEEIFVGSEEDVDALASMDIDAELADIDELDDPTAQSAPHVVPEESELDDLIFDAEPLPSDEEEETVIDLDESLELELDLDDEPESEPVSPPISEDEPQLIEDPLFDLVDQPFAGSLEADSPIPENLKGELRSVLNYMDKLLDSLPEEKIQEFAASEHFKVYKRLFEELGLEQ